jgi:hypothetical protein
MDRIINSNQTSVRATLNYLHLQTPAPVASNLCKHLVEIERIRNFI